MNAGPSKYFIRMVVFILLLGTMPVFLLGMFSYFRSAAISQEKMIEGNMSTLYQTEMRVEQLLKTVENAVMLLQNSFVIQTMKDRELTQYEFQYFNELFNQLHHLQSYESGIQDVTLVNFHRDWIVNNRMLQSFSSLKNKESLERYLESPKSAFWLRELPPEQIPPGMSTSYGINFVKKLPVHAQTLQPLGMLIAKIQSAELNKILVNSVSKGITMILDESGRVIASVDDRLLGKDLSGFSDRLLRSGGVQEGYFENDFEGVASGITFRKSSYNGWYYIYVIPIREIAKESRVIGWITLSVSMGVALIILAASFFVARRMYHPIKQLVDNVRNLPYSNACDDAKSDEFQLIGRHFQTMRDRQLKLEDQIRMQYQFLRELFILKLIQGKAEKRDIREKLSLYGYSDKWWLLNVMSVQIDSLQGTRYNERDRDLLLFAVGNIVSELIPANRRLSPIVYDSFQVTIVGSESESERKVKADLFETAELIQSTVANVLGLEVSIGISNCCDDILHIGHAYQESIEALRHRMRLNEASILLYENVQPGVCQTIRFPEQIEAELLEAVKLMDIEKAEERLDQFLNYVFSAELDFRVYQMLLVRLLVDLEKMVEPYGISLSTVCEDEQSLFQQLFELKTAREIKEWFRHSIIAPIACLLEKHRHSQYRKISDQMLELIHQHFHQELTLESCAKVLNYHPNYIKRVFRNEIGMSFSEYLMQYRLNMAKKWLADTDMKISEIAEKVGYSSPQNFIRNFRKLEGMTPGKFREKAQ